MKKEISLNDKFFIAGASGMAGRAIHRSLVKKGYGDRNLGGAILTSSRRELDLLKINEVEKWFKANKPDVVIIAAAKVGGILANSSEPTEFLLENLKIQNNIIETSWRYGVRRLLFLGSSCIYPKFAKQPITEEALLTGELEQTNQWYAIAKIAGIKLCEALRKQYSFDALSLMPTNLYGPGDNYNSLNSHVMASLIKKFYTASIQEDPEVICWGTGNPLREFLHVDDLGNAAVFALESWSTFSKDAPLDKNGEPLLLLNVGTGRDISIKDLAKKISEICSYKGKIIWDQNKPDGTPKKQLNIKHLLELGWEPTITLEEGIRRTLKDFPKENLL